MEMVSSFYYNYIRGDIIMLEDLKQALQEALPELRNNIFIDAHKLCVYIGIAQSDYDMRAVSIFWITSDFYNIHISFLFYFNPLFPLNPSSLLPSYLHSLNSCR